MSQFIKLLIKLLMTLIYISLLLHIMMFINGQSTVLIRHLAVLYYLTEVVIKVLSERRSVTYTCFVNGHFWLEMAKCYLTL